MAGTDQILELDTLLDLEHQALLGGDLDHVVRQAKTRERLLANLGKSVGTRRLSGLKSKLIRNQNLLEAAMEGLRSVQNRMANMKDVRNALQTYDPTGQVSPIDTRVDARLERRF
ncbi:flagellar biosynthesis protein FlgN [Shimia biformata]|uniref:flagellar biosynthesis protein FlgN n=1 Tax=Shimia biformata TaxID=1294299 RepID=UPI00194EA200|nr:flagellar biosynthesis protein FlgN [Shimia biformata]